MTIHNSDLPRPYLNGRDERADRGVHREAAVLVLLTCARRDGAQRLMAGLGATDEEIAAYELATADLRAMAKEWSA